MIKRFVTAFAAVVIGFTGGSIAVAVPAQATDCPAGNFCLYTGFNATGNRYTFSYNYLLTGTNNGRRLVSGNNLGNSFHNRSGVAVILFDANNCSVNSWHRQMNNGQYATAQGSDWGLKVSSLQLWNASPLTC